MTITIPDSVLESARMSEAELRQEIAILLHQKEKITLAQASRLAEMDRLQFQHLLASRGISSRIWPPCAVWAACDRRL